MLGFMVHGGDVREEGDGTEIVESGRSGTFRRGGNDRHQIAQHFEPRRLAKRHKAHRNRRQSRTESLQEGEQRMIPCDADVRCRRNRQRPDRQLPPLRRHPGESRDPRWPWAPAFAGVTDLGQLERHSLQSQTPVPAAWFPDSARATNTAPGRVRSAQLASSSQHLAKITASFQPEPLRQQVLDPLPHLFTGFHSVPTQWPIPARANRRTPRSERPATSS